MRSLIRANMTGDAGLAVQGVCFGPLAAPFALAASAIGTAVSAIGTIAGGQAQSNALEFQAKQEDQAAGEARAAGQRQAQEQDRKTQYVQSKLQANAAASGAGATDPTVISLGEDIAGRGKYQGLMDTYDAENRARGLEDQAMASRTGAKGYQTGSYFGAAGTLLKGGSSFFDKYNQLYG